MRLDFYHGRKDDWMARCWADFLAMAKKHNVNVTDAEPVGEAQTGVKIMKKDEDMKRPEIELMPCPFCGGSAEIATAHRESDSGPDTMTAFAECAGCGATVSNSATPSHDGPQPFDATLIAGAAGLWNTRHNV